MAQSIKLDSDLSVVAVDLKLFVAGSPSGMLTLKVEGDSGGGPNGNPLATAQLNIANISSLNSSDYTFTLSNLLSLAANQSYWFRVYVSYPQSGSDYVYWMANDSNAYVSGSASEKIGSLNRWSQDILGPNRDFLLKLCGIPCAIALTTEEKGAELGLSDPSLGGDEVAQSFQVQSAKTISQIFLRFIKLGTPAHISSDQAASVAMELRDDSSNTPNGGLLASSTLPVASIGSESSNFYTFDFNQSVTLTANKTYWLRLKGVYQSSSSDLIQWMGNDSNPYSSGAALYETSTSDEWSYSSIGITRDLLFKLGCN